MAWSASVADYLLGLCVSEHLKPFWRMESRSALAWVYTKLVDHLVADSSAWTVKRSIVIDQMSMRLLDPFIITDETWGTGKSAEHATRAWEERFAPAVPRTPPPPPEEPPAAVIVT